MSISTASTRSSPFCRQKSPNSKALLTGQQYHPCLTAASQPLLTGYLACNAHGQASRLAKSSSMVANPWGSWSAAMRPGSNMLASISALGMPSVGRNGKLGAGAIARIEEPVAGGSVTVAAACQRRITHDDFHSAQFLEKGQLATCRRRLITHAVLRRA